MGLSQSRAERECIFCAIAEQEHVTARPLIERNRVYNLTPIFYRDELVVAFYPRGADARQHVLVIPRAHRGTVRTLAGPHDAALLAHMRGVGERLLEEGRADGAEPGAYEFNFHLPPFNSIEHLHLHCIELPHGSTWRRIAYGAAVPVWPVPQWCASYEQIHSAL